MVFIVFAKNVEIRRRGRSKMSAASYTCEKCLRTMDEKQFYTYKNGEKVEICKKCLTMHIDNFNPDTFLWLLEKMDVPYIPSEWNVLRDRAYAKDPTKMNGMTVFGKYLSKMRLKKWLQYGWADSAMLQALELEQSREKAAEREELEKMTLDRYENGEISEAEYKTLVSASVQNENAEEAPIVATPAPQTSFIMEEDLPDLSAELTEEDKKFLAMKWGRLYKPSEWIELEKIYKQMTESFDIQDADTINSLILICKTNLKMNQAIDIGDLDGFQKLSRVFESLRKSAKFTAAQNKEEKNDFVDSVGELVGMCEREGFIPRFPTDIPQDKVDLTLKDMNKYIYKLVTQDLGFGQQIEDALQKIKVQQEIHESKQMSLDADANPEELIDEDYEEFYQSINKQKQADLDMLEEGGG